MLKVSMKLCLHSDQFPLFQSNFPICLMQVHKHDDLGTLKELLIYQDLHIHQLTVRIDC